MAINRIATASGFGQFGGFTLNINIPAGDNRLVLAFAAAGSNLSVNSITASLSSGGAGAVIAEADLGSGYWASFYWKEEDISSGSQTVSFNVTNANDMEVGVVLVYENVDQGFASLTSVVETFSGEDWGGFELDSGDVPSSSTIVQQYAHDNYFGGPGTWGGTPSRTSVESETTSGSMIEAHVQVTDSMESTTNEPSPNDLENIYTTHGSWNVNASGNSITRGRRQYIILPEAITGDTLEVDVTDATIESPNITPSTSVSSDITNLSINAPNIVTAKSLSVDAQEVALDSLQPLFRLVTHIDPVSLSIESPNIQLPITLPIDTRDISIGIPDIEVREPVIPNITDIAINSPDIISATLGAIVVDVTNIAIETPVVLGLPHIAEVDVTNVAIDALDIQVNTSYTINVTDVVNESLGINALSTYSADTTDIVVDIQDIITPDMIFFEVDVTNIAIEVGDITATLSKHLITVEYVEYCFIEVEEDTYRWSVITDAQDLNVALRHDITVADNSVDVILKGFI